MHFCSILSQFAKLSSFVLFNHKVAVKRIILGKFGACAGQACIAIDYILVEKKFAPTLVRK